MSALAIAVLAVGTYAMRSAGLFAGARAMPPRIATLLALVPAALLAALVTTQVSGGPNGVAVDARLAGIAAAAVALSLRAPFAVVVGAAMLVTALLRLAA